MQVADVMVGDVMVGVALSAYAVSVLSWVTVTVLVIVSMFLSVSGSVTVFISVSVIVSVLEVLMLYDCLVPKLSLSVVTIHPLSVLQSFVLSFRYFQLNSVMLQLQVFLQGWTQATVLHSVGVLE